MAPRSNSMQPVRKSPKMLGPPKMTALELLQKTRKTRRELSRNIAIRTLRRIMTPKGLPGWSAFMAVTYSKDTKQQYICQVFGPDENISGKSLVVVNCSCPDYVYTYEVANAKKGGAAFVYRSNGDDPGVRNPLMRPGLCKHAYIVLRSFIKAKG